MNRKAGYVVIAALIVLVAAAPFLAAINGENSGDDTKVNKDVIRTRAFSVNSDSVKVNTSAKGTVFIKGAEGIPEHVQIVARIEIDPDDPGGVVFHIPVKWHISGITSSYPENKTQATPADYVTTLTTADPLREWNAMIGIGCDFFTCAPTRGGGGTVVIDLVPDKNAVPQSENCSIMVAVGSDERNGTKIVGPDYVKVPLSLTDNG